MNFYDRVKMSLATTGTGTITLGSAQIGFRTFDDAGVTDGEIVSYGIEDGANWETGTGTYTASGTTLTRTVLQSSNAGAAIDLSANAVLWLGASASDLADIEARGDAQIARVDTEGTAQVAVVATAGGNAAASAIADIEAAASAAGSAQLADIIAEGIEQVSNVGAALLSPYIFASTGDAVGQGIISTSGLVAGGSGTNGTYDLILTGGTGSGGAGRFTVAGNVLTSIIIRYPGVYTVAPTLGFTNCPGLTGASATAVLGPNTSPGQYFLVYSATAGEWSILYQNVAGAASAALKHIPDRTLLDAVLTNFKTNGNTGVLTAWTALDGGGAEQVIMELKDRGDGTGIDLYLAGHSGPLTSDSVTTGGGALYAWRDANNRPYAAWDQGARLMTAAKGYVLERHANKAGFMGGVYDKFGDATRSDFFADVGLGAEGVEVLKHFQVCGWKEDANTVGCRYPHALVLSETATTATGLIFFSQQNVNTGGTEDGQRLVCRAWTFDIATATLTWGATTVIDTPANWATGKGKYTPAAAFIDTATGRPGILYNAIVDETVLQDSNSEFVTYRKVADDAAGTAWTAARNTLISVASAYAAVGVAVPGTGPWGAITGSGLSCIQIPAGYTHAGRYIMAMWVSDGGGGDPWYQCAWSDDGWATITFGTAVKIPVALSVYSEPGLVFCPDGSLYIPVRDDKNSGTPNYILTDGEGRGVFTSTDFGQTLVWQGFDATAAFQNVAPTVVCASYAAANGFPKLIQCGASGTGLSQRTKFRYLLSYNYGAIGSWVAEWKPYDDTDCWGYNWLLRLQCGYYLHFMESFANAGNINTQNSMHCIVFNDAAMLANAHVH